ncbi:MAG TPA: sigma-70 family RNA polymerase sigma factor [Candidatus Acidoferrales bacterium]|nr:sigma-70 family RNA polymerase sigma factor [Candidatus Acidoferrales bacterium]
MEIGARPRSLSRPGDDLDAAVLAAVARGDEMALRQLWERHAPSVHGYLRAICDDDILAEELLQDTFAAVWRAARSFSGRASVRTWIFGIARRRARDGRRRKQLDLRGGAEPDDLAPGPSTEEAALARVELAELAAHIRALRPLHREVLALAFSHELTHSEIALVLGVPIGTVKSRINAARHALVEKTRER